MKRLNISHKPFQNMTKKKRWHAFPSSCTTMRRVFVDLQTVEEDSEELSEVVQIGFGEGCELETSAENTCAQSETLTISSTPAALLPVYVFFSHSVCVGVLTTQSSVFAETEVTCHLLDFLKTLRRTAPHRTSMHTPNLLLTLCILAHS